MSAPDKAMPQDTRGVLTDHGLSGAERIRSIRLRHP